MRDVLVSEVDEYTIGTSETEVSIFSEVSYWTQHVGTCTRAYATHRREFPEEKLECLLKDLSIIIKEK